VNSGHVVVAAVAALVVVAAADAVRNGAPAGTPTTTGETGARRGQVLVDLASSRERTSLPKARLLAAFPGLHPRQAAVSRVAVAADDVVAVALSHVPVGEGRSRAAIELWRGRELVRAFAVPVGSFSFGLWFADGGRTIATIGWDEQGRVYSRDGARVDAQPYFAYETG
jgi:hypothetical protein